MGKAPRRVTAQHRRYEVGGALPQTSLLSRTHRLPSPLAFRLRRSRRSPQLKRPLCSPLCQQQDGPTRGLQQKGRSSAMPALVDVAAPAERSASRFRRSGATLAPEALSACAWTQRFASQLATPSQLLRQPREDNNFTALAAGLGVRGGPLHDASQHHCALPRARVIMAPRRQRCSIFRPTRSRSRQYRTSSPSL